MFANQSRRPAKRSKPKPQRKTRRLNSLITLLSLRPVNNGSFFNMRYRARHCTNLMVSCGLFLLFQRVGISY